MTQLMTRRVAIAGATGYSGAELAAILARHPHAEIVSLFSSEGGKTVPFHKLHPALAGLRGREARPFSLDALLESGADTVFLATPAETSAELGARLLEEGKTVIDVSAAFRLRDPETFKQWYGFTHPAPNLLAQAVYGLTEWCQEELTGARLVANPGCYPTAVLLPLKPLSSLVNFSLPVICDAKSGVSGAGKKSDLAFSFSELSENFKAYGVAGHRHEPEMRQELGLCGGVPFSFVAHLLPIVRGMLATIHVTFKKAVEASEIENLYAAAYENEPFVTVLPPGETPDVRSVARTPRAAIGFCLLSRGTRGVLICTIDNLLKGAASQAVQNFNRVFGFEHSEGLL